MVRDADTGSNPTDNPALSDLIATRISRRSLLGGGAAMAAVGLLGVSNATPAGASTGARGTGELIEFTEVPVSSADTLVVPEGYVAQVLIPWGTPLSTSGPAWKKDASNTAEEQAVQIGMHHDGMKYFPLKSGASGSSKGLLVLNHEYVDPIMLTPDGATPMTPEKVAKGLAAHGVTVIEIREKKGVWAPADSEYNRRITGTTPVTFSGPVGPDHPALAANNPPMGTLNNCANGFTPWNTYLTCEENWNGTFGTTSTTWTPSATERRYGITAAGFNYNWHLVDPRFDVAVNPKELNRFGWVVEIDPFDPESTPVKRTALGRIKHESATFTEGSQGRAVIYTGDDENGDYFYKFVGSDSWRQLRQQRKSPLDHGTLYVAKFANDGSGTWVPLVFGQGALTAANGWTDQADVLLRTREAADAVGATKLDRPEWVTVHPETGEVYVTLTNGTQGATTGPDSPNPRPNNIYGHILRISEAGGDNGALTFEWDIAFFAGDPGYLPEGALVPPGQTLFGSPDGLYFDRDGRLWIETDISNSSQNLASRKYDRIGNNALLAADPATGVVRRFLTGPRGSEITGITQTPDSCNLFVNIQHPGETTTAWGTPTPANPRVVSNWPDFDPAGRPRPATVVIRKKDGGKIGT
ncbi:PhoX family phosphatase [Frankia sp. CN6]|uniref:PhoX family phosphatase n=1 Tax=Frankia nepalensis TaxID=1836974 RepID=A0A937UQ02_9ACTN|nr:PhoX family phosphatase [Frankia nepalensis]